MASQLTAAQKAILARLQSMQPSGIVAVSWPNAEFVPPDPGTDTNVWAKVDLLWGDSFAVTMGAIGASVARNTTAGVIQITVFAPSNVGQGSLNAIVDAYRDVLSRQEFSGVRCGVASGPMPMVTPDDAWTARLVRIPFTTDDLS